MANFVCDICGGAIKMQANRTGVCQGCGMEYDIEAIRAMVGQANNAVPTQTAPTVSAPAQAANDNELDRDALLIYLSDLRVFETILNENKGTILKINEKRAKKQSEIEFFKKPISYDSQKFQYQKNEAAEIHWGPKVLLTIGIALLLFSLVCLALHSSFNSNI